MSTGIRNTNSEPLETEAFDGDIHAVLVPELGMWKKFSSHYEFPLSVLMSVVLHLLAVMLVLAYMAIALQWATKPPDMELITIAGGGGDGDGYEKDAVADDSMPELKIDLTEVEINLDVIDPTEVEKKKEMETAAKTVRKGDIGRGGSGSGGGEGTGFGKGKGSGIGDGVESGDRLKRPQRWILSINFDEPEDLLKGMQDLDAIVIAQQRNEKWRIYEDVKKDAGEGRVEDEKGAQKYMQQKQRIWYTNRNQGVCTSFAEVVGLNSSPRAILLLVPQALEVQLLKAELGKLGLSEKEVEARKLKTRFKVTKVGAGQWDVRVLEQGPNVK